MRRRSRKTSATGWRPHAGESDALRRAPPAGLAAGPSTAPLNAHIMRPHRRARLVPPWGKLNVYPGESGVKEGLKVLNRRLGDPEHPPCDRKAYTHRHPPYDRRGTVPKRPEVGKMRGRHGREDAYPAANATQAPLRGDTSAFEDGLSGISQMTQASHLGKRVLTDSLYSA